MGTRHGIRPLEPPVPLSATRGALPVNDEPVKVLNFLYFFYFFWKWSETFEKLQFLTSGQKQCFYLTHATLEYLEKLAFNQNKKHNFKRLYPKY